MANETLRLAAWLLAAAALAPAAEPKVAVVTVANMPAYQEALDGLASKMGRPAVVDLGALSDAAGVRARLAELGPQVVVAVGSQAVQAAAAAPFPVVATMVMEADRPAARANIVGTVALDVSLSTVLSQMARIVPGKIRIGFIRAAGAAGDREDLAASARRQGFEIVVQECTGPDRLLEAFLALKNRVDFVWCAADPSLFSPAALKVLLMASLRNQLPIIGFSESFVKAGAAAGVYPDFRDIGVQTAELVQRYLASHTAAGVEFPRTVKVGLNDHVLRLFGIERELRAGLGKNVVVFR
jgi:ABC-type uncharacterized transport system substrate-binding protein